MKAHDTLVQEAREAIDAVFGDSNVDLQTTLNSLEELAGEINDKVLALSEDIRKQEEHEG